MKSGVSRCSSWMVSRRVLCVGALSALDVVWHTWAGDRDELLFCAQSIGKCQFHTRSHKSRFDWAQGLRHFHCSRWHAHCLVADQSYLSFGISLKGCRYFHILSTSYEPVWQIFGLKNLCVNTILVNVVFSQNLLLSTDYAKTYCNRTIIVKVIV